MNKDENDKNMMEDIAKFAKYDNHNNFDDYFVKIIPELSMNIFYNFLWYFNLFKI